MIRLCVAILFVLLPLAPARADTLVGAGEGRHFWVVTDVEGEPAVAVLHRTDGDEPGVIHLAATLGGSIAPGAAAGAGGRLYLVYEDRSVQWLSYSEPTLRGEARYGRPSRAPGLPDGVTLKSLAATRRGPVALVQRDADDQLLRLDGPQWQTLDLPAAWPHGVRGWAVMLDADDARPCLAALAQPDRLTVYEPVGDEGWRATDYAIADAAADRLHLLAVADQLVLGRIVEADDPVVAQLSMLRDGRITDLGELRLAELGAQPWSLAAVGSTVALIAAGAADEPASLRWTSMDLRGRVTPDAVLRVERPTPIEQTPGRLIVVAALSLAMLLMFTMWRREPLLAKLKLPEGAAIADLPRRTLAAAIDLAPGALVTLAIYPETRADWTLIWPGSALAWDGMMPGIVAIAVICLHTTIGEMFFARSIGKAACGLRVVSLTGEPPNVWQAITRNVLRAFDLVAWYILPILVVLSPYRQRLGDMLARTLVIATRPEPEE